MSLGSPKTVLPNHIHTASFIKELLPLALATMLKIGRFVLRAVTLALVAILIPGNPKACNPIQTLAMAGPKQHSAFSLPRRARFSKCAPSNKSRYARRTYHIEVHYASFEKLANDTSTISSFASQQNANSQPIAFHALKGSAFSDALNFRGEGIEQLIQAPGISGLTKFLNTAQDALIPWSGPEYLRLYQEVLALCSSMRSTRLLLLWIRCLGLV